MKSKIFLKIKVHLAERGEVFFSIYVLSFEKGRHQSKRDLQSLLLSSKFNKEIFFFWSSLESLKISCFLNLFKNFYQIRILLFFSFLINSWMAKVPADINQNLQCQNNRDLNKKSKKHKNRCTNFLMKIVRKRTLFTYIELNDWIDFKSSWKSLAKIEKRIHSRIFL